jgi:hypothetical protein
MPFNYKNPVTSIATQGTQSVRRTDTFGNSFSVNNIGGYMEVYNLSDLSYTIPSGSFGVIEYSGNSIPIDFIKGNGNPWSLDVLNLSSDNISSGRRRLGMLVYVYEEDQVYQFHISGYSNLWSAATASTNCVNISEFGTTVNSSTAAGQNLINAWTASTIEDVSGYTSETAVWRKFNSGTGSGSTITGGGTNRQITKWTSSSNLGDSQIYDDSNNVVIGGVVPDGSAILELQSTTMGFLPPVMTESERDLISSPAVGLIIYQTDGRDGLYIYKKGGWTQMI